MITCIPEPKYESNRSRLGERFPYAAQSLLTPTESEDTLQATKSNGYWHGGFDEPEPYAEMIDDDL